MADQCGDLFAALAERRDAHLDDVEPVIEVFAKLTRPDPGLEISIRRGDDADVRVDDPVPADPGGFAVLEDVEELGLQRERHLADLVEHQRAPMCDFELAGLVPVGARERAFLMAEQLALEELARHGRAVDLQQELVGPRRRVVNRPGDDFLADPALATQKHGHVGAGDLRDHLAYGLHCTAGAELQGIIHAGTTLQAVCRILRGSTRNDYKRFKSLQDEALS